MIIARKNIDYIYGNINDVKIGQDFVFEEKVNGKIKKFVGLDKFVEIDEKVAVFDNHNYALYFWIKNIISGKIQKSLPVIHIDQHSDMNNNSNIINIQKDNIIDFVEKMCNVGNFLIPAQNSGIIGEIKQIRTEFSLLTFDFENTNKDFLLDIDLDFWDYQMSIKEKEKTYKITKKLIQKAKYVTIATSPFFMEQKSALETLRLIM